jgi:hypothetical protein
VAIRKASSSLMAELRPADVRTMAQKQIGAGKPTPINRSSR